MENKPSGYFIIAYTPGRMVRIGDILFDVTESTDGVAIIDPTGNAHRLSPDPTSLLPGVSVRLVDNGGGRRIAFAGPPDMPILVLPTKEVMQ